MYALLTLRQRHRDRQTETETHRQTDRDRETDRQTWVVQGRPAMKSRQQMSKVDVFFQLRTTSNSSTSAVTIHSTPTNYRHTETDTETRRHTDTYTDRQGHMSLRAQWTTDMQSINSIPAIWLYRRWKSKKV